jgi:hypothetical protein
MASKLKIKVNGLVHNVTASDPEGRRSDGERGVGND